VQPGILIGAYTATMFATASMINYANQSYYYNEGVFYEPSGSGYTVVQAPSGAEVSVLPTGSTETQVVSSNYYYFGGVFYQQTNSGL
jgi:hypothetical protein